ncbi:twin-arginine translocation signal domain-containing protein [Nocardiopsis potens]|uniref:twin-arginine translocation signal domain-containing protein n=1 Tax=Nocardiopsis potens TaxID=1246458 RepID=UPI00034A3690|nr:NAD(P)-binding protein [Nocardiopsis potens]
MSDQRRRPGDSDSELGMDRRISRRDFFDGASATAVGGIAAAVLAGCAPGDRDWAASPAHPASAPAGTDYPPSMEGLRGNTQQALSIPHSIRDGRLGSVVNTTRVNDLDEHYDLVVVGSGISGLSAAHFYKKKHPEAKILILDNHDEFGGHARRNEFTPEGRDQVLIGYGGTQAIDTPSAYSKTAMGLLKDLGIEVDRFKDFFDQKFYDKWKLAEEGDTVFLRAEEFRTDHLAVRTKGMPVDEWLSGAPLEPESVEQITALYADSGDDPMPGLSAQEKQERLSRMTYTDYLRDVLGCNDEVLAFMETITSDEWAVPASSWGAIDAWGEGLPGFAGIGLDDSEASEYNCYSLRRFWKFDDPYIHHFPDGNASIARLLVHSLIPGSVPGSDELDMESVVLAEFDYSKLDEEGQDVRLRLQSPCTGLAHDGPPSSAERVFVTYHHDDALHRVTAGHVVMAAWHVMGKYLMQELPGSQRQAMTDASKQPLVYANVVVRNWQPWVELGMRHIRFTGGDWAVAQLDYPVSMGGYEHPKDPSEPMVIQMISAPSPGEMSLRQGAVHARHELLRRPFESFERSIRQTLNRALGDGGFDAARDIEAITVNRWGHGYAREYTRRWDSFWPNGPTPAETARKRIGRITIANSDAAPNAYTDTAIDQAHRAVEEFDEL